MTQAPRIPTIKNAPPETELERLLKHSDVMMNVDKVLDMAKTMTTISVYLPRNKTHLIKTMPMKRH